MRFPWKPIVGGLAGATVAAAAIGAGLTAAASTPPTSEPASAAAAGEGTITVSASGAVRVDPDTAIVNLGVQANAATGAEAMEQVNTSSAALIDALIASGIAAEDIQTSGLSLWTTTDDTGEVNGYQASVSVDVIVRDIEAVGPTIDTAQGAAGEGFTIGGVSFSFADPESVLGQARIDAVELARSKAEQYAAAAGVTLGDRGQHLRAVVVAAGHLRQRRHGHGRGGGPAGVARPARPHRRHHRHLRHHRRLTPTLNPALTCSDAEFAQSVLDGGFRRRSHSVRIGRRWGGPGWGPLGRSGWALGLVEGWPALQSGAWGPVRRRREITPTSRCGRSPTTTSTLSQRSSPTFPRATAPSSRRTSAIRRSSPAGSPSPTATA